MKSKENKIPTAFVTLGLVKRIAGDLPLEQLRGWNDSGRFVISLAPQPCLPPVVIVLARDLQNVADVESDSGGRTRYQLVSGWIVVELRSHKNLNS